MELADLTKGNEIMLTISADGKTEFDEWVEQIKIAVGTIFFGSNKNRKELYDKHGFYVCAFADPDGHKFNLFYNKNR